MSEPDRATIFEGHDIGASHSRQNSGYRGKEAAQERIPDEGEFRRKGCAARRLSRRRDWTSFQSTASACDAKAWPLTPRTLPRPHKPNQASVPFPALASSTGLRPRGPLRRFRSSSTSSFARCVRSAKNRSPVKTRPLPRRTRRPGRQPLLGDRRDLQAEPGRIHQAQASELSLSLARLAHCIPTLRRRPGTR